MNYPDSYARRPFCAHVGSHKRLGHIPPWGRRGQTWRLFSPFDVITLPDIALGQKYVQLFIPDSGSSTRHVSGTRGCDEETIQTTSQGFRRREP